MSEGGLAGPAPPSMPVTMKSRILLVPDWLGWITGTEAKAIKAYNPQLDCDIVPSASLRYCLARGWRPEKEFDVVHLFTTNVAREFGRHFLGVVPTVTSLHHIHDEEEVAIDTSGDAIMTVSGQWEEELIRRGIERDRFVRVANGVDTRKFRPPTVAEREKARRNLGLREGEVAVGFVGKKGSDNFGRKGFDIYCRGLALLKESGVNGVAVVLGSGWQDDFKAFLPPAVRRIHLPHAESPAGFYQALDFYWVCSRIEGGPVPLVEAMASGVPCVCRKVGMVAEAITSADAGIVLSEGSPEEFAEATKRLIKEVETRDAVALGARRAMVEKFDWSVTAPAANGLYRQAANNFTKRSGTSGQAPNFGEPAQLAGPVELESVAVMQSVPESFRNRARLEDELLMARELFRVRNNLAATKLCWRLFTANPAAWKETLGLAVNSWKAETTVMLGRWKREVLGKRRQPKAAD